MCFFRQINGNGINGWQWHLSRCKWFCQKYVSIRLCLLGPNQVSIWLDDSLIKDLYKYKKKFNLQHPITCVFWLCTSFIHTYHLISQCIVSEGRKQVSNVTYFVRVFIISLLCEKSFIKVMYICGRDLLRITNANIQ